MDFNVPSPHSPIEQLKQAMHETEQRLLSSIAELRDKVTNPVWLGMVEHQVKKEVQAQLGTVKAEANAGVLNLFGVQAEYGLFKHEYSVTQFLAERAQHEREKDVDRWLLELATEVDSAKNLIAEVKDDLKSTAADIRRAGDQQLRNEVPQLRGRVTNIQQRLLADDQELHGRITKLRIKVGEVSEVAHRADNRSESAQNKAKELNKEVKKGLRDVETLLGSAMKADGEITNLISRVTALERALR